MKGKNIPENAIVAGEERRQPLYIARTFYEVSDLAFRLSRDIDDASKGGLCTIPVRLHDTY